MLKKPKWLKAKLPSGPEYHAVNELVETNQSIQNLLDDMEANPEKYVHFTWGNAGPVEQPR